MPILAQEDSLSGSIVIHDAGSFMHDAGTYFLAPLHFSCGEWILAGSAFGSTLLLSTIDESSRSVTLRNRSDIGGSLAKFGTEFGRVQYGLIGSAGLYLGGMAFKSEHVRITGLMLLESIAFAGITTTAIKSLAGRSRPYLNEGAYKFQGIQFDDDRLSFPSGHATVAFAISSVLAERMRNIYATVALYTAATVTACSRIYNDEHWLSDVFFGSVIGTVSGLAVSRFHGSVRNDYSLRLIPRENGMMIVLVL